jgi:hypothetical protein
MRGKIFEGMKKTPALADRRFSKFRFAGGVSCQTVRYC